MNARHCVVVLNAFLIASAGALSVRAQDLPSAPTTETTPPPIVQEFRYRLSGAVRPLLFWMGDSDVGGARFVRRADADSCRGLEFLIGTDPARSPRNLNRWGWVLEEQCGRHATQRGLMSKVDEKSLKEIEAKLDTEKQFAFKAINTDIEAGAVRATNTVWIVPDNYTYYDLDAVQRVVGSEPQRPPRVNEGSLPADTHPGLLFAVSALIDQAVNAAAREPRDLLQDVTTTFNFDAVACTMTLEKTRWEGSKEYGDHLYDNLIRMDFTSYNPGVRETDHFTIVCGTQDPWRGVPVYMKYQARWWFKSECVLDQSQVFERPAGQAVQAVTASPKGAP